MCEENWNPHCWIYFHYIQIKKNTTATTIIVIIKCWRFFWKIDLGLYRQMLKILPKEVEVPRQIVRSDPNHFNAAYLLPETKTNAPPPNTHLHMQLFNATPSFFFFLFFFPNSTGNWNLLKPRIVKSWVTVYG